jgi:hypothetical protein
VVDFVLGGPARGDDFCFRAAFLDALWDCLKKNNVLLVAPRRMGKTSVMYRLVDHPRNNHLVVYLSVDVFDNPGDFFINLIIAIKESQPDYFYGHLGVIWGLYKNILRQPRNIEPFEIKEALRKELDWSTHWEDQAGQLINGIRKLNQPILFIIDELPDMFLRMQKHSPNQLDAFLHWFRVVREIPNCPIRWVVGGSTNMIAALDKVGHTKLINDFYHMVLPPFSLKEVENFILKVFSEQAVKFDAKVIPRVQELLGQSIPFFLQLMTSELIARWKQDPDTALTKATVDEVFEKELLGLRMLGHLQHYHARIEVYFPEIDRDAVYDILSFLAISNGVPLKTLFARYVKFESKRPNPRDERQLMQSFSRMFLFLQIDFYVEDIGDRRYDFANRLIKSWWKKYYGEM